MLRNENVVESESAAIVEEVNESAQAHRMLEHRPLGGVFSPVFHLLGRFLARFTRSSEVDECKRPPLLSSTPWFGPVNASLREPFDLLCDGFEQCGPIFRFELLGKTTNVVTGPEALRLAKCSDELGLGRRAIFEPFVKATGVPIFSAEGAEHEQLRRLVRFGYTRGTIAPFVGRMSQTARAVISDWPTDAKLQPLMADLAIRVMATTITPEPLALNWSEMGTVGEIGMMVTVRQRPRFMLRLPRMKRSKNTTIERLDPIINRHRQGLTQDDPMPWMIDAFLAAKVGDRTLDDVGIRGGVIYALIASYIYLGRQTLFMLVEAARDARTMAALKREVDTAFANAPLSAETLRKMPTLRSLFVEANRRYPLLPGMPYETTRQIQIGDFTVGARELVLLTGVPGHFDANHYRCPWSFDPSRVRPPRNEHRAAGAFAPWGFPPRSCLAIGLCELVSTTIVANILHEFDLEVPHRSESLPIVVSPLVGVAGGQQVRLHRRAESSRLVDPSALFDEGLQVQALNQDLVLPDFVPRKYNAGNVVVRQGDPAEEFFIILDGRAELVSQSPDGVEIHISTLGPGQAFGETGILKRAPRIASVRAVDSLEVLSLHREAFLDLAADMDEDATHLASTIKNRFLSRSLQQCIEGVRAEDLRELDDIQFDQFDSGEWIVREADPAEDAYIVVSGQVQVVCNRGGQELPLAILGVGDIFGEIGVLESRPRTASVRASEPVVVARLGREVLTELADQSPTAASGLRLLVARRLMRSIEKQKG